MAEYVYSGKVVDKSSGFYKSDLKVNNSASGEDWTMSVTEISSSSVSILSNNFSGRGSQKVNTSDKYSIDC